MVNCKKRKREVKKMKGITVGYIILPSSFSGWGSLASSTKEGLKFTQTVDHGTPLNIQPWYWGKIARPFRLSYWGLRSSVRVHLSNGLADIVISD